MLGAGIGYVLQHDIPWQRAPLTQEDALSWEQLDNAYKASQSPHDVLHQADKETILALNGKRVALFGYIFPQESGEKHRHFLLAPTNHTCPFCMPSTVGKLVEVFADEDITYTLDPILLEGTLHIKDAKTDGLVYELSGAINHDEE